LITALLVSKSNRRRSAVQLY